MLTLFEAARVRLERVVTAGEALCTVLSDPYAGPLRKYEVREAWREAVTRNAEEAPRK